MEEQEFKQAYREVNPQPCPFEKAVLSYRCGCEKHQRVFIAEREGVACQSQAAQSICQQVHVHLQKNAQFALKLPDLTQPLPHAKAMKLQCGGLVGLQQNLADSVPQSIHEVNNIYSLIREAVKIYQTIAQFPYSQIVKFIVHYQVRKHKRLK